MTLSVELPRAKAHLSFVNPTHTHTHMYSPFKVYMHLIAAMSYTNYSAQNYTIAWLDKLEDGSMSRSVEIFCALIFYIECGTVSQGKGKKGSRMFS